MKKIAFIIVPHQDDEINLAGNIIDIIHKEYEIFVLYSSLDKREKEGSLRKKEALSACGVFGIDSGHIIFLNYPDTSNAAGSHYYSNGDVRIVKDLKAYLLKLKPCLIFATDFDYHSDHRMLSLAFDTAMGQILNEQQEYRPIVLKGFCYETAYYGPEDYRASNLGKSKSKFRIMSNCSLEWEKRLSISRAEKAGFIWKTKTYKALKCHRTQYAVLHARSIINADNVFWLKRTDNLINSSKIAVSSGTSDVLHDFKIIDTQDIITLDPRCIDYSVGVWFPQDKSEIIIEWEKPVEFDRIIFHGSPNCIETTRVSIDIMVDGIQAGTIKEIQEYGRDTVFQMDLVVASRVTLHINSYAADFGLSEIEILNGEVLFPEIIGNMANAVAKESILFDTIDAVGYKIIVLLTKAKRKILKTIRRL